MSEEEKEAIKVMQEIIDYLSRDKSGFDSYDLYKTDIDTLITIQNLIKKQQELNEVHQKINGELRIKVKELENADLTVVYLDGVYDGKNKYKNKIKEKIEEVKNSKENYTFSQVTSEDIRRTIITNLQELLGE